MPRVFEWFQFGVLVCWGLLAVSRAIFFKTRGISIIAIDRERTPSQMIADALAVVCLLVLGYEIVAYAWHFHFHVGPARLHRILVESITIKIAGALIVSIGIVLYAVAVRHLGESWRLGIDRTSPGPLVSSGVYRWMRHPIYVAFDLLFVATFLVLGRLIFLLLALIWLPLMHRYMAREECFLSKLYGDAYRDYSRRVRRYGGIPHRRSSL